ncbi:MAG TPA: hypothetical protein VGP99_01455 [Tepidisphaeraceae bacterium]|nr:hypothetical protein [Tepidisphaeraceae bacterium]
MKSAPTSTTNSSTNLFCISCGYSQRGITATHCPECGQDFSTLPPSPTRLLWLQRRHLGLFRAYCRTALMVILRPKLFCEQIDNPITLRDARRFWLLTILFAYLPLLGAAVQLYHTASEPGSLLRSIQLLFVPPYWPIGVFVMLGLLLFIITATGMASYFCHPRALPIERQNRAIALSYFAPAPLALMLVIVAFTLLAQLSSRLMPICITFQILAALVAVFMLGAWYIQTVRIALVLSQRRRRILTAFMLTCAWMVVAASTLIMVPIGLCYIARTIQILF